MRRLILAVTALLVLMGCAREDPDKYLQEGVAHFEKQDYDQAIASYQKALKLAPKNAIAYNLLGMAYRMKFQQLRSPELKAQEIAAFEKAIEIDPSYWVAYINLGATYFYQGDKTKAAPLFKKALDLKPDHPEKAQIEKMIAEGEGRP
jgi:tetratricopeptide (TPR) repeat protein